MPTQKPATTSSGVCTPTTIREMPIKNVQITTITPSLLLIYNDVPASAAKNAAWFDGNEYVDSIKSGVRLRLINGRGIIKYIFIALTTSHVTTPEIDNNMSENCFLFSTTNTHTIIKNGKINFIGYDKKSAISLMIGKREKWNMYKKRLVFI